MLRLGREGVLARPAAVPGHARRHRAQLPRGDRVPRPPRSSELGVRPGRRVGAGRRSTRAASSRRPGRGASRNRLQTTTLLDAIEEHGFDAVIGGARRDEEKARAKERFFSFRDEFGQWDPKNQRPELWNLYNGRAPQGRAHPRVPALELDRARHLAVHRRRGHRAAVDLLRAPARGVPPRRHADGASPTSSQPTTARRSFEATVRYRTVGDATCTGAVESTAATIDDVIAEVAATRDHRARRHPRRRPVLRSGHGRPQARGLLLNGAPALRHRRVGRRRQVAR